jgi:neutral ceramidase
MKKLLIFVLILIGVHLDAQQLRLGVGEADITPPVGAPLAGYYYNRDATGVHDPLHVKAMVLEQGGVKIAMAALDLVSVPRDIVQSARALVQQRIGLIPDHVMISATHAHTTPVVLTNPSRYDLQGRDKEIAQAYTDSLPGKIADAIIAANARLQPVEMLAGVGQEKTLSFNRRFFMKDGTIGWNPGKLNPNIFRPAGPIDPGLPVLYFESPKGTTAVAAYVNFGLHQDTTGGPEISADFSYTLGQVLKMVKGDSFFPMFTIGAAGNVVHIDTSRPGAQMSYHQAARIGAVLAGDVLKVIETAPMVNTSPIRVSDKILQFPVPRYTQAEIDWAVRTQATYNTQHAAPFLDLVKAARILELNARHGKPLDAEVQVLTLGNEVAIVGFPGEMFAEFGLQLKEDSPFPVTIVAELANGALTYIPNRIAYKEGNYEPTAARLPAGAGEKLVNSALDQLLKIYQEDCQGK